MKLGHNDNLGVGIIICTPEGFDLGGGSNSGKYANNSFSETTGQI